jgi:hypothetical protein
MNKRLMLTTFIDDYVSAEETEPVAVVISGSDAWSVEKSEQLIKAARKLYEALCELDQAVCRTGLIPDDEVCQALINSQSAIAAACGAVAKTAQRPSVGEKAK